jgi:hypothetical protein
VLKWLRKLFDVITAGEAPADVDAAAHRSALWTAFITCCVLYTVGIVLNVVLGILFTTVLSPALDNPSSPLYHLATYLTFMYIPGPGPIIIQFSLPFFIYAFALHYRKGRLPFSVLMLVSAIFLSFLMTYSITGWMYRDILEVAFFVLAVATLRLIGTKKRWKLVSICTSIILLTILIMFVASRIVFYTQLQGNFSNNLLNSYFVISYVLSLALLPVYILLPIGLMSDPPAFALQGYYIAGKQPGRLGRSVIYTVLVLVAVYGVLSALANVMSNHFTVPWALSFLDSLEWSIYVALFVLAVTTLLMRRASRELIVFLFLIPLTMQTSRLVLMLSWLPANGALTATLLLAGLVALALADEKRWSMPKLRAAGVLAAGSVLLWLWCWLVLPKIAYKFDGVYVFDASYPIFSAVIGRLATLAYIPAILFAAWWFISPKEIESLVLGKAEPVMTHRDIDGAPTP